MRRGGFSALGRGVGVGPGVGVGGTGVGGSGVGGGASGVSSVGLSSTVQSGRRSGVGSFSCSNGVVGDAGAGDKAYQVFKGENDDFYFGTVDTGANNELRMGYGSAIASNIMFQMDHSGQMLFRERVYAIWQGPGTNPQITIGMAVSGQNNYALFRGGAEDFYICNKDFDTASNKLQMG